MNKLNLKAKFFALYIGQETGVYYSVGEEVVTQEKDIIMSVSRTTVTFSKSGTLPISNCQLILRPASSVTPAERQEMMQINSKWKASEKCTHIVDYLRSKGFLTTFLGLDAEAELWAITS